MDRSMLISRPVLPSVEDPGQRDEHRLELLIERLPSSLRGPFRWLRRPSSRWVRIPASGLLIVGGVFSFLPILGLWMLPLGLVLLAEDTPLLRRRRGRVLDWIAEQRPHWLAPEQSETIMKMPSRSESDPSGGGEK